MKLNMSLNQNEYLRHILDEIIFLNESTKGLSYDEFVADQTRMRAFSRSLEIIGEASKKISEEFKQKHNNIEWKAMAGMRDKLIHDYFGVDFELIWDVVQNKLPTLETKIQEILAQS